MLRFVKEMYMIRGSWDNQKPYFKPKSIKRNWLLSNAEMEKGNAKAMACEEDVVALLYEIAFWWSKKWNWNKIKKVRLYGSYESDFDQEKWCTEMGPLSTASVKNPLGSSLEDFWNKKILPFLWFAQKSRRSIDCAWLTDFDSSIK